VGDRRGHEPAPRHDGTHGHSSIAAGGDRRYLYSALALILSFMVFEVVVGLVSGSLALLADAGHMLTDVAAIATSVWVTYLVARPPNHQWTFGLKRAEIISAAGNGVTLVVVAALVLVEAIHRLVQPPPVEGLALVIVAGVGIAVNLAATIVLSKANRESLNVEGAFQHILTDLYAFVGTAVAGLVIILSGYRRADPIASLVVVILLLRAAWGLLHASGRVLLEGTPQTVDLAEVRQHITDLPEVLSVHDVHAWMLTSELPVLTAHVVVIERCLQDGSAAQVLDHLQACLAGHFDVEHSTFQLELSAHSDHEHGHHD
jgi:cobalt-zinc-cadmium efflux system protein